MSRAAPTETCHGCGAVVPVVTGGPTHRYMSSAPGCWSLYGGVLGREYSDIHYAKQHQLTVDAYALQHPGEEQRATRRSVNLHLCSLHGVIELGMSPQDANRLIRRLAERNDFEWLTPPEHRGAVTVVDVHTAPDAEAHLAVVSRWARCVWQAWAVHHRTARMLVQAIDTERMK